MQMPAVTFSVQVGSDGFAIAQEVASELGYRYYDWKITSKAAELAGPLGETSSSDLAERILSRLSTATVLEEELPAGFMTPSPSLLATALKALAAPDRRATIEDVVRQLAAEGESVIVGHGSQIVLSHWPGVLKVLVRGSFDQRARRLAAEQNVRRDEAIRTVMDLDRAREDFFQRIYGVDWLDSALYDLTINTDQLPAATATEMIIAAVTAGGKALLKTVPAPLRIEGRDKGTDTQEATAVA